MTPPTFDTDSPPPTPPTDARRKRRRRRAGDVVALALADAGSLLPLHHWRKRAVILFVALGALGVGIVGQLAKLQFIQGDMLKAKANAQHHSAKAPPVYRGRLLDRHGKLLAQDALVYDVYLHPRFFEGQTPEQVSKAMAPILQQNEAELLDKISKAGKNTVTIARGLSRDRWLALKKLRVDMPIINEKTNEPERDEQGNVLLRKSPINGLDPYQRPTRHYPEGNMAAHVLGFVNDYSNVVSGVQAKLAPVWKVEQQRKTGLDWIDGKGQPLVQNVDALRYYIETGQTHDVELTLDKRMQFVAEAAIRKGVLNNNAERGVALMMDVRNGELLSFASYPTFSPSQFWKGKAKELKNWAITDVYEPGSTIKILTTAIGLDTGVITPSSRINDVGKMNIGGWWIQNYDYNKRGAPGSIDLVYLLQHSSNIGSATIAMRIPEKKYYAMLDKLGFGHKTGIDITGESAGRLPPLNEWGIARHASLGYGYGLISTPLQLAAAVGAVANGGVWVPPHVIRNIRLRNNEVLSTKEMKRLLDLTDKRQVFKPETSKQLTALLEKSLSTNKDHPANLGILPVAGKTGTARKAVEGAKGYGNNLYTSFIGYFPAYQPKYLIMVVVDSPKRAEAWGSTVAAPVFREMAMQAIHYYGLAPNKKVDVQGAKLPEPKPIVSQGVSQTAVSSQASNKGR
ncbi:MAG: peptidoglycan D,D-transpeptidase FtsI family protein [Vampirovibrionales bacterium]